MEDCGPKVRRRGPLANGGMRRYRVAAEETALDMGTMPLFSLEGRDLRLEVRCIHQFPLSMKFRENPGRTHARSYPEVFSL